MTDNRQVQSDSAATDDATTGDADGIPPKRRRAVLLLAIASVAVIVDLVTKIWAVDALSDRGPLRLLGGALYLTLARNSGAAFSMGTSMTVLISCLVIVVAVAIVVTARKVAYAPWAWALGLILGGALGNLIDRLFRHPGPLRGAVIDFLSVLDPNGQVWPIFNVADMCVVTGGILAGGLAIFGRELDGRKPKS